MAHPVFTNRMVYVPSATKAKCTMKQPVALTTVGATISHPLVVMRNMMQKNISILEIYMNICVAPSSNPSDDGCF